MERTGIHLVEDGLHSTMVRLQVQGRRNGISFYGVYIPLWLDYKIGINCFRWVVTFVYIPLWLDYKSSTRKAHGSKEFGAISVDHSFYILLYKILLVKNKQF